MSKSRAKSTALTLFSGYAALAIAVLIWGGSFLAGRVTVQQIPPLTTVALRFALAAVLLVALVRWRDGQFPRIPLHLRSHIWKFGFVLVTLGYGIEYAGIRRTSSGDASVLISLVPVFTVFLGTIILREEISRLQWLGIAIASVGSVLLMRSGRPLGLSDPLGDCLLLVAAALNSYANMLGKRDTERMDPFAHTGYGFAFGSLLLLPVALYEWHLSGDLHLITPKGIVGFLYLLVPATIIAYPCFFYGLRRVGLSAGSVTLYFMGPITVVLAAVVLGETLTPWRLVACIIVAGGAALAGSFPSTSKDADELSKGAEPCVPQP